MTAYLSCLAREGLEREPSQVWVSLATACADIEAIEIFPDLHRAYAEGLIDRDGIHPSELDQLEGAPRGVVLEDTRERYAPIDDVAEAIQWWSGFSREATVRSGPKVGRNDPCPCGSGRKYKKCCCA